MIDSIPIWVDILFILSFLFTVVVFYLVNGKPKLLTGLIIVWAIIHSFLAFDFFYIDTTTIPPRFALVLIPATIFIIYGLLPKQIKWLKQHRNKKLSPLIHLVRLPVEIVLHQLFVFTMIPQLMTYEGRNFDIIMGVTAPIILFLLLKNKLSKRVLIGWNIMGLALVLFILFNGILSVETPFQQFGFDQPNRALLYFPYILLPAVIVPVVVWTHISDLILLLKKEH